MARLKRVAFRVGAVLCVLFVISVVAEVAMRLVGYTPRYFNPLNSFHVPDDEIGYLGKPDFEGRFFKPQFDVVVKHDRHGFRLQEVRNDPATCRRTLYALGDSFTWGWGVGQGVVYTEELSRRLPKTQVRNLGLNASGTLQQLRIFRRFVEPFLAQGDVVLVAFFANDFGNNVHGSVKGIVRGGRVLDVKVQRVGGGLKNFLKEHSHLFNFLNYSLARARAQWSPERGIQPTYEDGDDEIVIVRHCLDRLREACAAKGVRFLVVGIPGGDCVGGRAAEDALTRCCAAVGVELLALRPHFEARRSSFLISGDEHWNAAGHALAGRVIAAHLAP